MGERLLCKQEVVGSIPITSTTARTLQSSVRRKARERCVSAEPKSQGAAAALAPREHWAGFARSIGKRKFAPELRLLRV